MGSSYKYDTVINTYDTTADGRISPIMPLSYFQEAAQRHLKNLNIGLDFAFEKDLAWILVKYEIDFFSYPKGGEKITVETEATGYNRFEAFRRFSIFSENGEEIISGKSVWMLANIKTGRPIRVSGVKELEILDCLEGNVYKIPRLIKVDDFDIEKRFDVRYLDIDINQHVNNTKYVAWGIETLPLGLIKEEEIEKIIIIYKKQAFYGEEVIAKSKEIEPHLWRIDITNTDGEILCEIEIKSRKREIAI